MSEAKAIDARTLKRLNEVAAAKGYNRQIADDAIDRLDPQGWNIGKVVLLHEHAGGKVVDPHYRCNILMKWKGDTAPHSVMLDVPMDVWAVLKDAEEFVGK